MSQNQGPEGLEGRELLPEENEVLKKGAEYKALTALPGWKRLLDFLEQEADAALGALRQSESLDPFVNLGLKLSWKHREHVLQMVQVEAAGAIQQRAELVVQLLETQGEEWLDGVLMQEAIED